MATVATMEQPSMAEQHLYTCLSCAIAFTTAEEQRAHYRSDHHRYNMKRRVANLPPVSAAVFNQKVLERRAETAVMSSTKGSFCEVCGKQYTTENAYRSHINSKKHKDNEVRAALKPRPASAAEEEKKEEGVLELPKSRDPDAPVEGEPGPSSRPTLKVSEDATEDEVAQTIDEKIAAARSRLSVKHCLFCPMLSESLEDNLTHMSTAHSFFIPDAEYLVDLPGLITYLGEKIAVGNVCIYCNAKSREFRTLEAVRKHMLDKSHCKIAYDREADRLEVSDYYDFSSSYPDYTSRKRKKGTRTAKKKEQKEEEEEWEDLDEDDDGEVDEVIEEDASSVPESDSEDSEEDEEDSDIDQSELTYGDSPYELVLPSGARIGHRSLKRYYTQSFSHIPPRSGKNDDPNSGAALVRRLLADKNSALVPRKGGFGAFGGGTDVVKARNAGEAKEAGRHVKEFRDQRRREEFKTKVGFRHNHQKHYRDPLLQ